MMAQVLLFGSVNYVYFPWHSTQQGLLFFRDHFLMSEIEPR